MEECPKLSQTPTERRDHCISEHKFPHDFRFDCYKHTKKHATNKSEGKATNAKATNSNIEQASVLKPSKLGSVAATHDEDIELENKSILLTAQRKPFTNFSFGHKKSKTFQSSSNSYAKQLAAKSAAKQNKPQLGLDDVNMVDELMDSLPK